MTFSAKQKMIVKRRRRMLLYFLAFSILVIGSIVFSINSNAESSRPTYKYYTSYEVQPGDTLWTIADAYLTVDHNDKDEYIDEIKRINHMLDDNITAGQFLVVSYYSYDFIE